MQPLAQLGDQLTSPPWRVVAVARESFPQALQLRGWRQASPPASRLLQGAAEKRAEALLATLKVGEAPLRLESRCLLQQCTPAVQIRWAVPAIATSTVAATGAQVPGFRLARMSCNHKRSASWAWRRRCRRR